MNIENINMEQYKTRAKYSHAKKIDMGNCYLIFTSGFQAPKDENQRVVTSDVSEQTRLIFEELKNVLELAGASLDNVVKATIYLTDMKDFDQVSKVRSDYFINSNPVSTMIEVSRMTRDGAKVEIEVMAIMEKP